MAQIEGPYTTKTYFALGLDPVHIGSGEDRLGHVDNPIVREPGTRLPKIPATSLAGSLRKHVTLYYSDRFLKSGEARKPDTCAEDASLRYCGKMTCPVCVTFGFPKEENVGVTSMVQFFDGHLLFFPVHTMIGPVWVVSPSQLQELINAEVILARDVNIRLSSDSNELQTAVTERKLNLGWLLLQIRDRSSPLTEEGMETFRRFGVSEEILSRLTLTSDRLFGQVVNNNLEVRTSTSIDPITGASREGALFHYEAVPRSTVFSFTIIYKDPRNFQINGEKLTYDTAWVQGNVEHGLRYYEYLGIGGMVTRGMGRLRILNL